MATVFKLKSDRSEEQNPQAPQQEQKLSSFQTPTSNQTQTTNVPTEQRQAGSGRFQNLEKMLDANKQQQFGQQFGARVEDQAKGMQSKAESNVKEQQDQWSGLRGQIENQGKLINQVKEDPTKVDVDQWKYYQGGGYQSDVNAFQPDTTQANIQAGNIQQLAGDVSTTEGRSGVLSNIYAKPGSNYTAGMNRFDNLFLQKTPGQLASVQEPVKQIGQQTQSNIQNVLANIGSEKESTLGQIESLIPQGQEAVETGISNINNANNQELLDYVNYMNNLRTKVQNGELTPEELSTIGITSQAFANIYGGTTDGSGKILTGLKTPPGSSGSYNPNSINTYGVDIFDYLTIPEAEAQAKDFIDQNEAARLNALDVLSGGMGNTYSVGDKLSYQQNLPVEFREGKNLESFVNAVKAAENEYTTNYESNQAALRTNSDQISAQQAKINTMKSGPSSNKSFSQWNSEKYGAVEVDANEIARRQSEYKQENNIWSPEEIAAEEKNLASLNNTREGLNDTARSILSTNRFINLL